MDTANGQAPNRAARRRAENNTRGPNGLGTAEDTLAKVIGESVALHLAPLLQPAACALCATRRKIAQRIWEAAVQAVLREHEVKITNAMAAAEPPPPDPVLPDPPELPGVQKAFTWLPIVLRPGLPPQVLPVCYDDMPASAAEAGVPPQVRETGLVLPDGRPVVAQSG